MWNISTSYLLPIEAGSQFNFFSLSLYNIEGERVDSLQQQLLCMSFRQTYNYSSGCCQVLAWLCLGLRLTMFKRQRVPQRLLIGLNSTSCLVPSFCITHNFSTLPLSNHPSLIFLLLSTLTFSLSLHTPLSLCQLCMLSVWSPQAQLKYSGVLGVSLNQFFMCSLFSWSSTSSSQPIDFSVNVTLVSSFFVFIVGCL